jgi:hypothetical protein
MPVLDNPKWERFCQNIVNGVKRQGEKFSQGRAYVDAGYNAKDVGKQGGSAEACASRLLNRAKLENRIAELLQEAQAKATSKRAYDIDTITERIGIASKIAEEDRNPSALYGAEKTIAEVRGLIVRKAETTVKTDNNMPTNSREIAIALLRDIGLDDPSDEAIELALEAYDRLVAGLERVRDEALGLKGNTHHHYSLSSKHEH